MLHSLHLFTGVPLGFSSFSNIIAALSKNLREEKKKKEGLVKGSKYFRTNYFIKHNKVFSALNGSVNLNTFVRLFTVIVYVQFFLFIVIL